MSRREEAAVAEMIFAIHSGVRYLVLVLGLAAAIVAWLGWRRATGETGTQRGVMTAFVAAVDVQVLLGIVLVTQRPFFGQLMGHIVMMVLAAVAAHAGSVLAKRRGTAGGAAARVRFIAVAVTLVLIVGGIMAIGRPIV